MAGNPSVSNYFVLGPTYEGVLGWQLHRGEGSTYVNPLRQISPSIIVQSTMIHADGCSQCARINLQNLMQLVAD